MKQTCGALLRSYILVVEKKGQRTYRQRPCTAPAVHNVPGFGPRCRRHAPTGEPCPACNRLICRTTLSTLACVFAAYRHRFEKAGWVRCGRYSDTLERAGVRLVYVPHCRSNGGVDLVAYAPRGWPNIQWPKGPAASLASINAGAAEVEVDDIAEALDRVSAFLALASRRTPVLV